MADRGSAFRVNASGCENPSGARVEGQNRERLNLYLRLSKFHPFTMVVLSNAINAVGGNRAFGTMRGV